MAGRLEGKVCVVTGASGGIGAATVAAMQREGARVAGVDLLEGAPGDLSIAADVTSEEQVADYYRQVSEAFGRIDVLFNNAGISPDDDASVLDTSVEAWQRVQDVNLKSVFLCCKHGIPYLLENEGPLRGSVVNTASFVATLGAATSQISYTASKGGVLAMSRELGVQFARSSSPRTPSARRGGWFTCRPGGSPRPARWPRRSSSSHPTSPRSSTRATSSSTAASAAPT
jgi:NAD(P)-dependent dehydrogenase (short-subunit alcohol dehydrogenase family)